MKKKSHVIKFEIETLEAKIEEDVNGLNMVFDYIISQVRQE